MRMRLDPALVEAVLLDRWYDIEGKTFDYDSHEVLFGAQGWYRFRSADGPMVGPLSHVRALRGKLL